MQTENEYKYSNITQTVIGCAMRVHSELGNGFHEIVYQRALRFEMKLNGLAFDEELEMPVYYKSELVGKRRVDFLVEKVVLLELKALGEMGNTEYSRTLNYLKAYDLEVALLINFGENSLKFKRFARYKNYTKQSN